MELQVIKLSKGDANCFLMALAKKIAFRCDLPILAWNSCIFSFNCFRLDFPGKDARDYTSPFTGALCKPQSNQPRKRFLQRLAIMDKVEFRPGRLSLNGWKIRNIDDAVKRTRGKKDSYPIPMDIGDFCPNFVQKMVDAEIILDTVRLAEMKVVQGVVFLTSDEGFVPAIKYIKDKGLRAYLMALGCQASTALQSSVDCLLDYEFKPGLPQDIPLIPRGKRQSSGRYDQAKIISLPEIGRSPA